MAAGLSALKALNQATIDRINALGERLREGLKDAFDKTGLRGQVTGIGSLNQVHWCETPLNNARESGRALKAAAELPGLLHLEMMNRGIYCAKRGMFVISTPMKDEEIDQTAAGFAEALAVLKPYIAARFPQLSEAG
jgi:glutamate-1-semialdehyde 2,1-aminomutase